MVLCFGLSFSIAAKSAPRPCMALSRFKAFSRRGCAIQRAVYSLNQRALRIGARHISQDSKAMHNGKGLPASQQRAGGSGDQLPEQSARENFQYPFFHSCFFVDRCIPSRETWNSRLNPASLRDRPIARGGSASCASAKYFSLSASDLLSSARAKISLMPAFAFTILRPRSSES